MNRTIFGKLSDKAFDTIKKGMPPISDTEREAITAGDTWIESSIFQGNIDWVELKDIEKKKLSEKEISFIKNEVQNLCESINDYEISKNSDLPEDIWEFLKDNKIFAMIIPESYGGLGFSSHANSTIVAKIASVSVSVAVTVMVPNSLGPGELLMKYGTVEQKNKWLPDLSSGKEIPCFALTSPVAGSDAGAIPDKGIVCNKIIDGKEVLGISVNFNKRYITLAPVATLLGLAFKMYDPDGLIGEQKELGITCALVAMNTAGIDNSNRHDPMHLAFMNGPVFGTDVFIPLDSIIGGVKNAGKGWKMLVECLSAGRGISLPALSAATSQSTYKTTSAYSYIRKQFGLSIGKFEGVEESLARIAGFTYMIEATRNLTTTALDLDVHPSIVTAITKYHTTEMARQCLNDSMDIHAGRGIIQGKSNYLNNGYLGIPIAITVEGANILTRNLMIFGQGSMRCHPYLFNEMEILNKENEVEAKIEFEEIFKSHIKYTSKNSIKSFINAFTFSFFEKSKNSIFYSESKNISRLSKNLSVVSDLCLLYLGGKLKQKEFISARLGDVLSYLYIAMATIKYAEENNHSKEDVLHAKWSIEYCLNKSSDAFDDIFNNFPSKLMALKMRSITFPLGIHYKKPSHVLSQELIKIMHDSKSEFRARISDLCITDGEHNPMKIVELAFHETSKTVELEKIIVKHQRSGELEKTAILTDVIDEAVRKEFLTIEEAEKLIVAENYRMQAIQVDHKKT